MRDIGGKAVGPYRVWLGEAQLLGLAMSRSLGDTVAHTVGVSPQPEVRGNTYVAKVRGKFMDVGIYSYY